MRGSSRAIAVLFLVVLAAGIAAGPAAATARATTFWLYMGQSGVSGYSSDGAKVHLVWRGASGAVKCDAIYTASKNGGWWEAASDHGQLLRAGDVIRTTVAGVRHRLVVPNFTIRSDATADTVHGRAPAGSVINVHYRTGDVTSPWGSRRVRANALGKWSFAPGIDVLSTTYAYARWHSAGGDTLTVNT